MINYLGKEMWSCIYTYILTRDSILSEIVDEFWRLNQHVQYPVDVMLLGIEQAIIAKYRLFYTNKSQCVLCREFIKGHATYHPITKKRIFCPIDSMRKNHVIDHVGTGPRYNMYVIYWFLVRKTCNCSAIFTFLSWS